MSPAKGESFHRRDAHVGCIVNLYCAKAWAERRDYNELSEELFEWARSKALELKSDVNGMDWVALATRLYEGDVAEEAHRLFPGFSGGAHAGSGLVFFHLMGLIS